jgi:hypothetical protein
VADEGPHYHLVLTSEPGIAVPAVIRLRRLLKIIKRGYGFVCTSAIECPAQLGNGLNREASPAPHDPAVHQK